MKHRDFTKYDGRSIIYPSDHSPRIGDTPHQVRASQAVRLCKNFEETGQSVHSPAGNLVWVIYEYCRFKGYWFDIQCSGNHGWVITKLPNPMEDES